MHPKGRPHSKKRTQKEKKNENQNHTCKNQLLVNGVGFN